MSDAATTDYHGGFPFYLDSPARPTPFPVAAGPSVPSAGAGAGSP